MDKVHYKKPSFSKQCCMEEEHILTEQEIFVLKIIFEFFFNLISAKVIHMVCELHNC